MCGCKEQRAGAGIGGVRRQQFFVVCVHVRWWGWGGRLSLVCGRGGGDCLSWFSRRRSSAGAQQQGLPE